MQTQLIFRQWDQQNKNPEGVEGVVLCSGQLHQHLLLSSEFYKTVDSWKIFILDANIYKSQFYKENYQFSSTLAIYSNEILLLLYYMTNNPMIT